ncbi:MAG: sigma-70 family RNA polymerase sigma factor [Anaerolineae bacterium]|nr:sigma-70 family RNA polymerase sigma factor [Anaerolineae bacterium]
MHTDQPTLRQSFSLSATNDTALARRACDDPQAFTELYGRYLDRVYRFVLIRTGDTDDAQDLTSQTFLAALESIARYDGRGSFGGWLFGIARHKIADHYRRRRPDVSLDDAELLHHPDPAPEDIAHTHLQLARIARMLHSLDAQQAEAVALRIFGELDAAQVAQVMGKSEAAAKMLVHRGLHKLQERLTPTLEVSL